MNQELNEKIDIIGDIHGHYLQLFRILEKMGYSLNQNKLYHPENRKLGFVGDFINRGPQSYEVLCLVRSLCESGDAMAVLGNHEFRLIQNSVAGKGVPSEFEPFIPWLRTLPLFLELDTLRLVHAVWHFSSIELLKGKSVQDDSFIGETIKRKNIYQVAVSRILSGIKIRIPQELALQDRFGIRRSKGRLKWWKDLRGMSFAECFLSPMKPYVYDRGPVDEELSEIELYQETEKPVFTGHYCLPPSIPKISGNVVCLDGCVTCDQTLWAFRHEGTKILNTSGLVEAS